LSQFDPSPILTKVEMDFLDFSCGFW